MNNNDNINFNSLKRSQWKRALKKGLSIAGILLVVIVGLIITGFAIWGIFGMWSDF
ncbi:Uncharacterised protein [Metamycoplasma arthritidis]|uniref:Uncharacterized protein n=1 Tax=Metamycoplasma arthritidis (strain 158L3-1) TaxID=243272 RepID=B3PNG1_META1|nr:hypothetical protein [Metamycoplasma arthritidis]ACF07563.1 hypothetical protein MARTH_orf842 [Metamycoplasma arthritidis 158L3-1]VEU79071.1 Uncharacterised protein [Metamycoplasma arthritidis]